jgi:bacterioferritin-associated ferredoxin
MPHRFKPVRACICYPHSFQTLLRMARQYQWQTVEEITEAVQCGSGCGSCRPYLKRMLETGETAFEVLPASPPAKSHR